MSRAFRKVVTIEEAARRMSSAIEVHRRHENVSLGEALGRILAVDVIASMNVPPFDRAAMDGYALKARDTYGASESNPKDLVVKGSVLTGEVSDLEIGSGYCVAIPTGAPMPTGADAVVMVEYTERSGDHVSVRRPVVAGENVMRAGADISKGEIVLKKGKLLTPRDTGVLAALGMSEVVVYARPRVAVISTGTEIIEPGEPLEPGRIYDVNSRAVSDAVIENGGIADFLGIARDLEELMGMIRECNHDLILTSGGTSVGEEDLAYMAVEKLGKLLFHGVALKPGKPTMMGIVERRPLIGLPGYPSSALVVFYVLVAPLLRKMAGLPPFKPTTVKAKLASRVYSAKGRLEYVPVAMRDGRARPITKGSGAITTLAEAMGYVLVEENVEILEEGSEVDVVLFHDYA